MEKVATTFRIDPVVKDGLTKLSKLRHQSLNQLANEAIAEFVSQRIAEVENELQSTLDDLRAYRKKDPHFEQAIDAVVEAEVSTQEDPAEGTVVEPAERTESVVLGLLNE